MSCSGSSAHEPNSRIKNELMISTSAEDSDVGKFGTGVHVYAGETT